MDEIFELIDEASEKGEEKEYRLGLRIKIGAYEAVCPLTPPCHSYRAFELEMEKIKKRLEVASMRAKSAYQGSGGEGTFGIEPHMPANEIWAILSAIPDEDVFVRTFNTLKDTKRREIADHVLTKCNVFAGKASVFSSRYSEETGLME